MKRIGFEDNFSFSHCRKYGGRSFDCRDEIGNLWGIEKMLEIVDREFYDVFDLDFFEFGSAEFNIFNKIPTSGKVSHFMMFATPFRYACFDSDVSREDFDLVCEIISLHKKIMSGNFISLDELKFRKLLDSYAEICRNKDLPIPFVYEALAEEIPSLGLYYNLNLEELKRRVGKSSCNNYEMILEKIKAVKKSVVFSFNVFNAPSLSFEFPFWKEEDSFHVHGVNEIEMLAVLGFSNYFKDRADKRSLQELGVSVDNFILKFKQKFGVDCDVFYEEGFFWWKA